ncbi:MAG: hypothetical protein HZB29_06770 [Nitrospinae bacterium]|nr:hypothetical protein [Nitrospinota bacterium]
MTGSRNEPSLRPFRVFLIFTLLGVIYSWPAATRMFDAIPYAYDVPGALEKARLYQGDHLQMFYHLGLLKRAAAGDIPFLSNPLEFATAHQAKWIYTYELPVSLLYLPFTLVSLTFAYNMYILISFGLSGLSMYLWAAQLLKNRAAALAAAVVFDFIPLRLVELYGGHPAGTVLFLVPLTLFFFERAAERKSPLWGFFGGLGVLTVSLSYSFYCYFLLMFLMAYAPWRLAPMIAGATAGKERLETIKKLAAAGVPFLLGAILAVLWMQKFKKALVEKASFAGGRTMDEISIFSPKIPALWAGDGDWHVYVGLPLLLVLFVVAAALAGKLAGKARRDAIFFSAAFAVTYILAFGPTLDGYFHIYSLFYNYFPFFNMSRTPAKIMVIPISLVALLTAYAMDIAMKAARGRTLAITAVGVVIALTAFDYHPKKPVGLCLLDGGNAIYARIAKEAPGAKVLNIPIWPGESSWESIYEYYAVENNVPMINGYSPVVSKAYTQNVFAPLASMNTGDFTDSQARLAKELGVKFILFHEEAYPPQVSAMPAQFAAERLAGNPRLKLLTRKPPIWMFEIVNAAAGAEDSQQPRPSPVGIYYEAEWLSKQDGHVVEDGAASGGAVITVGEAAPSSAARLLNAGPYRTLPAGKYSAWFRLKTAGSGKDGVVAAVDVAVKEGKITLARREITSFESAGGGYLDYMVDFTILPGALYQAEFRVYSIGGAKVSFDSVYALLDGTPDPQYTFEAEELFHTGRVIEDKTASGDRVVALSPGDERSDVMLFGPVRMFDEGKYTATFNMAAGDAPAGAQLGVVEANDYANGKLLASRKVLRPDVAKTGHGAVTLDFTMQKRGPVEFKVRFSGAAELSIDSITVKKISGE